MLKKILLGLFIICNSTHSFLFSNTPQKEVVRVGYVSNDDMVQDITDNFNKGYGYDILKNKENVYYKLDHHYNLFGAYEIYKEFSKQNKLQNKL